MVMVVSNDYWKWLLEMVISNCYQCYNGGCEGFNGGYGGCNGAFDDGCIVVMVIATVIVSNGEQCL